MSETTTQPKVAINCITYNHEAYIRECIEGFLMQKTNFPFVVILHDDASTDGTTAIIREYAEKYPDIIKPIFETENQWSKYDGSLFRIMDNALLSTNAPYIAWCEGDDYWTDPFKLQKQVDFMESHPDYSLVFANVKLHYDTGLSDDTLDFITGDYTALDIYTHSLIATPTVLYRKEVLKSKCYLTFSNIPKPRFGDLTLFMASTTIGKVHGMNEVVCGYRRLSSGATKSLTKNRYLYFINRITISNYFGPQFTKYDKYQFSFEFKIAIRKLFNNFSANAKFILRYFWFSPGYTFKILTTWPICKAIHLWEIRNMRKLNKKR